MLHNSVKHQRCVPTCLIQLPLATTTSHSTEPRWWCKCEMVHEQVHHVGMYERRMRWGWGRGLFGSYSDISKYARRRRGTISKQHIYITRTTGYCSSMHMKKQTRWDARGRSIIIHWHHRCIEYSWFPWGNGVEQVELMLKLGNVLFPLLNMYYVCLCAFSKLSVNPFCFWSCHAA